MRPTSPCPAELATDRRAPAPTRHAPGLRVLTVNLHKGYSALGRRFLLRELRDALRADGSDLVFLQEVAGLGGLVGTAQRPRWSQRLGGRGANRQPAQPDDWTAAQCEFMADQIWADHAYGRNAVVDGRDHGNALLSRYPIVHTRNHDVSQPGDETRGLLHCVLAPSPGAQALHVVCVHLGLREAHRRRQLDQLCALLQREVPEQAPLVVAGDFNDWRSRADHRLRRCGLLEVYRQDFGAHARSFPAGWPLLRLDRIYVRQVTAARAVRLPRLPWSRLSDHAPLAAEIQL